MFLLVLVDASDQCNLLSFQLGNNGHGTTIPTRSWNIKVKNLKRTFFNV
jgi:hypothetical protein